MRHQNCLGGSRRARAVDGLQNSQGLRSLPCTTTGIQASLSRDGINLPTSQRRARGGNSSRVGAEACSRCVSFSKVSNFQYVNVLIIRFPVEVESPLISRPPGCARLHLAGYGTTCLDASSRRSARTLTRDAGFVRLRLPRLPDFRVVPGS
jgi:hypothetical protein